MTAASSNRWFTHIAELVARRTGILTTRAQTDLEQAARQVMSLSGIRDVHQLASRLADGALWDELVDRITIRETYFFRSDEQFKLVRDRILPDLARVRLPAPLRIWSAGCASGEEAYSLAILLHQLGLLDNATVFGSDVSAHAVAAAREGRYRDWSFRAIDPALIASYFRQERNERVVRDELRAHVRFAQLNLIDTESASSWAALGQFDLIFCRNVLIYFDTPAIAQVERRLYELLAPGGWLVTGPSDPLLGRDTLLEVEITPHGLCYRRPVEPQLRAAPALHGASCPPLPAAREASLPAASTVRSVPAPEDDLHHAQALAAFGRADYRRVIELARVRPDDLRIAALGVRATWNTSGAGAAERSCVQALQSHPLSAELHYLRAVTLLDEKRLPDALHAVQRALYLDRSLTVAHFAQGAILERMHDLEGARRAYRNTFDACTKHLPDEALAFGDGIVAQGLANAASHALSELDKRWPV